MAHDVRFFARQSNGFVRKTAQFIPATVMIKKKAF
jgi:hypothetical protein